MAQFSFLNTRPAHQAQTLSDAITQLGGQVLSCPTLQIEWLEPLPAVERTWQANSIIFTSANAVMGWVQTQAQQPAWQALAQTARCYAIGKATQQTASAQGLKVSVLSDAKFDSEHFLAHPSMQNLTGQKVALIQGEGGRDLLADTLIQRQADLIRVANYRRQAAPFCPQAWQQFVQAKRPVLLITSWQSWQVLKANWQAWEAKQVTDWHAIAVVVVMSQRIADKLMQEGLQTPIKVVDTQTNTGIIQAVQAAVTAS